MDGKSTPIAWNEFPPKEERQPKWRSLLYDYTQDTTMHGIRYVTLPTKYITRRIAWVLFMLGATCLFIYVIQVKLSYLFGLPLTVSVDVKYRDQLDFPTVTICNENKYRMSSLFEHGLYDLMVTSKDIPQSNVTEYEDFLEDCDGDTFSYYKDICSIPEKYLQNTSTVAFKFTSVTRQVCMDICTTSMFHSLTCSSVFYDSTELSCVLSPFVGQVINESNACQNTTFEFYRRLRCLKNDSRTIKCDFEGIHCPLADDPLPDKADIWTRVTAEKGGPIPQDNTLDQPTGFYYQMAVTNRRPGFKARVSTTFMVTSDTCVVLFYHGAGDTSADLTILVRDEEQQVTVLTEIRAPPNDSDWTRLQTRLPRGIYQVIIQGRRPEGTVSGLAIDDFQIVNCKDVKRDCLSTRRGLDYTGTMAIAEDGKVCQPWREITSIGLSRYKLPEAELQGDNSFDAAENYCRNIPGLGWRAPMCYTGVFAKHPTECTIPFCTCPESWFHCDNNFCVPEDRKCDGYDNCGDKSDEINPCVQEMTVSCDFENNYMCGYIVQGRAGYGWIRHRGPGYAGETSPLSDYVGSLNGYYMLIDSRLFSSGNRLQMTSKVATGLHKRNVVMFFRHINAKRNDEFVSLNVYLATPDGVKLKKIYEYNTSKGITVGWKSETTCAFGKGQYNIVFEAITGNLLASDIAIDTVKLASARSSDRNCPETEEMNTPSFNCSPTMEFTCPGYYQKSTNLFYEWLTDFKDSLYLPDNQKGETDIRCGSKLNYKSYSGVITSPFFPLNYEINMHCVYTIETPPGTKIQVTFEDFNLELPDENICYDYIELSSDVQSGQMCGDILPNKYTSTNNTLKIEFMSDYSETGGGFKLTYKTVGAKEGFAVALSYLGNEVDKQEDLVADFVSPPVPDNGTIYCLSSEIYVNGPFDIYLIYSETFEGHFFTTEDIILRVDDSLGPSWHPVNYLIKSPVKFSFGSSFRIGFRGRKSIGQFITAAFTGITIAASNCSQTAVDAETLADGYACYFDNSQGPQCGFVDQTTTGKSRWIRGYKKGSGFRMILSLVDSDIQAVLSSPVFEEVRSMCFSMGYRITRNDGTDIQETHTYFLEVKVELVYSSGDVVLLKSLKEHSTINAMNTELPNGTYSIRITTTTDARVKQFDSSTKALMKIDSVVVAKCNEMRTIGLSVACQFNDPFICGYDDGNTWSYDEYNKRMTLYPTEEYVTSKISGWLLSNMAKFAVPTEMKVKWFGTSKSILIIYLYRYSIQGRLYKHEITATEDLIELTTVLCLPAGEYSVLFDGEIWTSEEEAGNLAISEINLGEECILSASLTNSTDASSIDCSFHEGSLCYYTDSSNSNDMYWKHDYPLNKHNLKHFESKSLDFESIAAVDLVSFPQEDRTLAVKLTSVSVNLRQVCVRIKFATTVLLSVDLLYLGNKIPLLIHNVHQASAGLWNHVHLYWSKTETNNVSYQIQFTTEVKTTEETKLGPVFLLSSINASENDSCRVQGVRSSLECSFNSFNEDCGIIDNTLGPSKWLRTKTMTKGQNNNVFMETLLSQPGASSVLESTILAVPRLSGTKTCLSLQYMSSVHLVNLTILFFDNYHNVMSTEQIPTNCRAVDEVWQNVSYELSNRTRRISIEAILLYFDPSGGWARVDNIRISRNESECLAECYQTDDTSDEDILMHYSQSFKPRIYKDKIEPVLTGVRKILETKGDIGMDQLWRNMSHEQEEFISTCEWEGYKCHQHEDNLVIKPFFTEKGMCYSFTAANERLLTFHTGAEKGLRLLVNIEQYEHTLSYSEDAGIKVHAHSHLDRPNIRDLGFAVPPGTHTLVSMTYTETESLPHPYGKCEALPLQFEQKPYSKLKCSKECTSKYIEKVCGCISPDLPGNYDVCTLKRHLECKLLTNGYSIPDGDQENVCACTDNCTVVTHQLELSHSQISSLNAVSLLSNTKSNGTKRTFLKANKAFELRHRIDFAGIGKTINLLEKARLDYAKYVNYLEAGVTHSVTSKISAVQIAESALQTALIKEINRKLFSEFSEIASAFRTYKKPSIHYTLQSIIDAQNSLMYYVDLGLIMPESLAGYALKDCKNKLKRLNNSFDLSKEIQTPRNKMHFLPSGTNLFGQNDARSCKTKEETMRKTLAKIIDCVPDSIHELSNGTISLGTGHKSCVLSSDSTDSILQCTNSNDDSFVVCSRKLVSDLDFVADCYRYYEFTLTVIQTWLMTLDTAQVKIEIASNLESTYRSFQEDVDWLLGVGNLYYRGEISLDRLAHIITDGRVAEMQGRMDASFSQMQQEITEPWLTHLATARQSMIRLMSTALTNLYELSTFMEKKMKQNLEYSARISKLWQQPTPNFGSPLTIRYMYKNSTHVWPQDQSFVSFMEAKSGSILTKQAITNYYAELLSYILETVNEAKERKQVAENSFKEFGKHMTALMEKSKLDANFAMSNYLKLDVYYGELKYERVTQQKGYDVVSFFSDVGGYMGLLLGGSLITILEFLDLIVYNSLIKCAAKRDARQVSNAHVQK